MHQLWDCLGTDGSPGVGWHNRACEIKSSVSALPPLFSAAGMCPDSCYGLWWCEWKWSGVCLMALVVSDGRLAGVVMESFPWHATNMMMNQKMTEFGQTKLLSFHPLQIFNYPLFNFLESCLLNTTTVIPFSLVLWDSAGISPNFIMGVDNLYLSVITLLEFKYN